MVWAICCFVLGAAWFVPLIVNVRRMGRSRERYLRWLEKLEAVPHDEGAIERQTEKWRGNARFAVILSVVSMLVWMLFGFAALHIANRKEQGYGKLPKLIEDVKDAYQETPIE